MELIIKPVDQYDLKMLQIPILMLMLSFGYYYHFLLAQIDPIKKWALLQEPVKVFCKELMNCIYLPLVRLALLIYFYQCLLLKLQDRGNKVFSTSVLFFLVSYLWSHFYEFISFKRQIELQLCILMNKFSYARI